MVRKEISIVEVCFGPMIKYSKQSLKALSEVGVENCVASVVYIIQTERVESDSGVILRVYLLLTRDARLLSVDFRFVGESGETEVKVTEFVSSATFNSDPVVECEIALDSPFTDFGIVSVSTEAGNYDDRSVDSVLIDLKLPEVNDSFLVSNFSNYVVFPEVFPSYWMCTCGKINTSEHSACVNCGARLSTVSEFVSKGAVKVVCEQYVRLRPFVCSSGTFEENLSRYISSMAVATSLSESDIRVHLDMDMMKSVYGEWSDKMLLSGDKKRKNKLFAWVGGSVVLVVLLGYILSVTVFSDYLTYMRANGMFEKGEYASASVLFENLGEYKDSATKGLEAKYHVSMAKMGLGDYSSACTFFERYNVLDSPDKYKECTYLWAKDDALKGQYLVAADRLKKVSGYLDSFDLISSYQYEHALNLESSESLLEAALFFHQLKGYKDADKRLYYNLYLLLKDRFDNYGVSASVVLNVETDYSVEEIWEGLRTAGFELSITHDDVFWDIVFLGRYQNSSGVFIRRYLYKNSIWISYNLSSPDFEYFMVEDDTIMACDEDLDSCKPWLSVEFTSEKAITIYNHHDKKTYKLSK